MILSTASGGITAVFIATWAQVSVPINIMIINNKFNSFIIGLYQSMLMR